MTKSWVSGGKNTDLVDKLRVEISDLETAKENLVELNKKELFDWAYFALYSGNAPKDLGELRNHPASQQMKDVVARWEAINHQLLEKQVRLNDKLDEEARFDSLS